jgi:hypothetical protein
VLRWLCCDSARDAAASDDATEPAWNGYLLTMAVRVASWFNGGATSVDADADLISWAQLQAGMN